MPALITHHLFGENAVTLLPDGVVEGQEELIAFLLGNQGPDPFFTRWRTLPHRAVACHRLAHEMHVGHMTSAFMSLRDCVSRVWDEDKKVARAFALGMLSHYVLDSVAHPFIYAQEHEIVQAGIEGLEPGDGVDVHAVIESDLDSWVLWQERHDTVASFRTDCELVSTDQVDRVAGALLSQTALEVFGIELGPEQYAGSVRDYRFLYRAIEPPDSCKLRFLAGAERIVRPHSHLAAMSHHVVQSDECPAANLDRHVWHDPSTGAASAESFADLYHDALNVWPEYAEALVRGDEARLRALVAGRNYNGDIVADD